MIIEAQNVFMGAPLNAEKDALIIGNFLEHHINPVLSYTRSLNYRLADLPTSLRNTTLSALENAIKEMLACKPTDQLRWGFKNPRSMFVLPFIQTLYPDFMFIHVVRDGRDIALSANKNQPLKHFRAAFPESNIPTESPEAAIRLWAKTNQEVAAWCAEHKKNRYLCVRYEALCLLPETEIATLLDALQIPTAERKDVSHLVSAPPGIGRWQQLPLVQKLALNAAAQETLKQFSYL
jgi:hypothetical protein